MLCIFVYVLFSYLSLFKKCLITHWLSLSLFCALIQNWIQNKQVLNFPFQEGSWVLLFFRSIVLSFGFLTVSTCWTSWLFFSSSWKYVEFISNIWFVSTTIFAIKSEHRKWIIWLSTKTVISEKNTFNYKRKFWNQLVHKNFLTCFNYNRAVYRLFLISGIFFTWGIS